MALTENPYVGPRTFKREEGDRFYGRDAEARALLSLVISQRLTLFYAQSGAGKSSLVNTKLIPGLLKEGFLVLPTGRVSGEVPEYTTPPDNFFIFNLLTSLDQSDADPERFCGLTLADFLANLVTTDGEYYYYDDSDSSEEESAELEEYEQPAHVLIIDQFEEIFTTHLEQWHKRSNFFQQLEQAMSNDPLLWVVLVLREDYVASLDPYTPLVSNRMRARQYMQRMGYDAALEAVQKPAEKAGRPFADGVAERLVDNLRLVRSAHGREGTKEFAVGEFIEPVQLQVVCFQLWENLKDRPGEEITQADLRSLAKGYDLAEFVNRALAEFYEDALTKVVGTSDVTERTLRKWFSEQLITENETRGTVFQGETRTGGLPNTAVRILQELHLLRSEPKAGGIWIELVHDRFVGPILRANRLWAVANQNPLTLDAENWDRSGRDKNLLYEGVPLERALAQAEARPDDVTPLAKEFLQASQEEARRRQVRRQRLLLSGAGVLVVVLAFLSIAAVVNAGQARRSAATAETNRLIADGERQAAVMAQQTAEAAGELADQQRGTAVAAAAEAAIQRTTAEAASTQAIAQQSTAVKEAEARATQQAIAEEQEAIAFSRLLAAQARSRLTSQSDLAALLGVEAFLAFDSVEAKSILLDSLELAIERTFEQSGPPIPRFLSDVNSVAMSRDGMHLAWGSSDGSVVLWDYQSPSPVSQRIRDRGLSVLAVVFSPDGNRLASAGLENRIELWDVTSGDLVLSLPTINIVRALSFSPEGDKLAAGIGTQVLIWDLGTGEMIRNLRGVHNNEVQTVAWSPDGSKIASGAADRRIVIWTPVNDDPILTFREHSDLVHTVSWSPDSRQLASGGRDGSVIIRDIETGAVVGRPFRPHDGLPVRAVAYSPDGQLLASGGNDRNVVLTDLTTYKSRAELDEKFDLAVSSLAFSPVPGEQLLTAGSLDNSVRLFNVSPQQPLNETLSAGKSQILGIADQPGGRFQLAAIDRDTYRIWQIQGSEEIERRVFEISANAVAINQAGTWFAAGDTFGAVRIYDIETGEVALEFETMAGPVKSLAFSQDSSLVAITSCGAVITDRGGAQNCENNLITIWNLQTNMSRVIEATAAIQEQGPVDELHTDFIVSLAFSPDQTLLASGSLDQSIVVWDLATGRPTGLPLRAHRSSVLSLAFSPDGTTLASGGEAGTLIYWDLDSGLPIGNPLLGPTGSLTAMKFDESGESLYSGTSLGELSAWVSDFDAWLDRVCEIARRNLTNSELQQFLPDISFVEYQSDPTCPSFPVGQ